MSVQGELGACVEPKKGLGAASWQTFAGEGAVVRSQECGGFDFEYGVGEGNRARCCVRVGRIKCGFLAWVRGGVCKGIVLGKVVCGSDVGRGKAGVELRAFVQRGVARGRWGEVRGPPFPHGSGEKVANWCYGLSCRPVADLSVAVQGWILVEAVAGLEHY